MKMLHRDEQDGPSPIPLLTSSLQTPWMATVNPSASTLPCCWMCGQVTFLGTRSI